jgi:hypothetical protein
MTMDWYSLFAPAIVATAIVVTILVAILVITDAI